METKKNGNGKHEPPKADALVPHTAIATVRDALERAKPKLAEVMPRHLSADRLVRVTIAAISKTPMLQDCTLDSLLNAVMQAAQLGLEPTGVLGSAYLVPYRVEKKGEGNKIVKVLEAQLIVGYRGFIDLARRSGQIESIEAHVVHANDRFTCRYGLAPVLEHEPCWHGDPGEVVAVYAVAKLKDGGKQIEVMTRKQVDGIRGRSKAKDAGPWVTDYDEMARKTVVRRIVKYLPLTPELADALAIDNDLETEDLPALGAQPKGTEGLKSMLKASETTVEVKAEPPHDPQTGEIVEPPAEDDGSAALAEEMAAKEAEAP